MTRLTPRQMRSFLNRLGSFGPDTCWKWRGSHSCNGYPTMGIGGKTYQVKHLVWEMVGGRPRGQ